MLRDQVALDVVGPRKDHAAGAVAQVSFEADLRPAKPEAPKRRTASRLFWTKHSETCSLAIDDQAAASSPCAVAQA